MFSSMVVARNVAAVALVLSTVTGASAQEIAPGTGTVEFRITSGGLVATGALRNQIKDAQLTAAQLSVLLNPRLALTGTFSWARSRDLATTGTPRLDIFTSDIGAELRSKPLNPEAPVAFSAFGGVGAGMRSYNYRKLDVDATNNLAGYVSIGSDIGIGSVGLRLEVREYLSGFRPLMGDGASATRNDIVIAGALRFNRHRTTR